MIDYRGLNAQIVDQALNFPRAEDTISLVGQAKPRFLSKIDAHSGFFQIPLEEESRTYTTFMTHDRRYRYKVLPMGLKTSPKAFHNLIEVLLQDQKYRRAMVYMDDVLCYSQTWEENMLAIRDVFAALKDGDIKLKREKCFFGMSSLSFLGYVIDAEGIRPDPVKVEAVQHFPVPRNVRQVRSFNGLAQFYRRFIRGFSETMKPLYALTKSGATFQWTDDCQQAFDGIKRSITTDVILVHPDFDRRFTICTDASAYSVGACISQEDEVGFLRPKFRHYVENKPFDLYTDHAALIPPRTRPRAV